MLPPRNRAIRSAGTQQSRADMDPIFALPLLAIVALLITAFSIPPLKRLAWHFDLLDHPQGGSHKSHPHPIAYGGLAIILGLCPALALAPKTDPLWTLLACAAALFCVGLVDDWRGLAPLTRFLLQIAVSAFLVVTAPEFRLAFFAGHPTLAAALTILWIVALTNAFNFLDNMDGLAAGLAAIVLLLLALMGLTAGSISAAALSLALAAASAGFLIHNFFPARIFMGDGGAFFLGFMAGALSAFLSRHCASAAPPSDLPQRWAPLLLLAVPLYDFLSVIAIRLKNAKPPWVGDTNHVSHRLVRLGWSRRQAVLTLYLLTLLTGLPGLFVLRSHSRTAWLLLLLVPVFASILGALDFTASRRPGPPLPPRRREAETESA